MQMFQGFIDDFDDFSRTTIHEEGTDNGGCGQKLICTMLKFSIKLNLEFN